VEAAVKDDQRAVFAVILGEIEIPAVEGLDGKFRDGFRRVEHGGSSGPRVDVIDRPARAR